MNEIGQMIVVFLLVVLIIYLSYLFSKWVGSGMKMKRKSGYIQIVDQVALAQDKSLAVVQTGKRYFLIGISSSRITMLTEVEGEDLILEESLAKEPEIPFKELLGKLSQGKRKD